MQFSDSDKQTKSNSRRGGILEEGFSNEYEYEFVLEKIGFGKTQWILLLITGLLTLNSLSVQTSVGIIVIAAQCEFAMNQVEKGIMMAACVTGIFLSTYFWGYASDAIGRRAVLFYGIVMADILQFISMFVTNIWVFNVVNLFMGISLGGVSAAIYAYLSEFNTTKHRAVVINYSTMFVSIAAIYVPATAWLVLSTNWSITIFGSFIFRSWRLIILLNLLPGILAAIMLYQYPESPKLLLAQKNTERAIEAVEWICKFNTGYPLRNLFHVTDIRLKPEQLGDTDILASKGVCSILLNIWKATVPLFYKPHGIHYIISVLSILGMFFSYSGMQIWYPEIVNRSSGNQINSINSTTVCQILDASFERQMMTSNVTATVTDDMMSIESCDPSISTKTFIDNIIVGVAFLLGFIIQGLLLNPLGRKKVILMTMGISSISGILLHFISNSTVLSILFCLYILMPGLAISVMLGAVVDLVPTHLRGKAVSICLTLGRLGIIFSANLIGIMLEPLCNTTFGIFTVSMIICTVLVSLLPI